MSVSQHNTMFGPPGPVPHSDAVTFDGMINFEVDGARYISLPLLRVSLLSVL